MYYIYDDDDFNNGDVVYKDKDKDNGDYYYRIFMRSFFIIRW